MFPFDVNQAHFEYIHSQSALNEKLFLRIRLEFESQAYQLKDSPRRVNLRNEEKLEGCLTLETSPRSKPVSPERAISACKTEVLAEPVSRS